MLLTIEGTGSLEDPTPRHWVTLGNPLNLQVLIVAGVMLLTGDLPRSNPLLHGFSVPVITDGGENSSFDVQSFFVLASMPEGKLCLPQQCSKSNVVL
jgi:hypothetical protein